MPGCPDRLACSCPGPHSADGLDSRIERARRAGVTRTDARWFRNALVPVARVALCSEWRSARHLGVSWKVRIESAGSPKAFLNALEINQVTTGRSDLGRCWAQAPWFTWRRRARCINCYLARQRRLSRLFNGNRENKWRGGRGHSGVRGSGMRPR